MELRQLEYLVAVVDEGGFTRAAQRVHVTQPGISAQVRRLERELGAELVDRTGRAVRPTAAGEAVLPYARAALAAAEGARRAVEELGGLMRGRVVLGTVVGGGAMRLPALLAAFRRQHGSVELELVEATSDELLRGVREGRLDLALAGVAGRAPDGLQAHVLRDEELVAVVAQDDPWPGQAGGGAPETARTPGDTPETARTPGGGAETATTARGGAETGAPRRAPVGALADRPLIALPPGTGVRAALDAACAAAGVRPHVTFEAGDVSVLAELARLGLGVAVLPSSITMEGLRPVPLDPPLRSRVLLVWRAEGPMSPAARAMVAHLRDRVGATAGR